MPDQERPDEACQALLVSGAAHARLTEVLEREGWQPGNEQAEAVVVDLRDERELGLAAIRGRPPGNTILAILPDRATATIARAIDAGATHYIAAPFADEELAQSLRLLVRKHKVATASQAVADPPVEPDIGRVIDKRLAGGAIALLLVAATRFSAINAALGRDTGDDLLRAVGKRIGATVKSLEPTAVVMRLTGAEFVVVLGPYGAGQVAREIVARVERPFMCAGHIVTVGCRIGLVESSRADDAAALLRRGSAALAEARLSENEAIRIIGADEVSTALFDVSLEADLRRAVARDEIDILFQPQVEIPSGKVVGVEALARWQHPKHGEVDASTLFAVAERSDYLATLSTHLQTRALRLAQGWPVGLERLRLAINVTSADIAQPGFIDAFQANVTEIGFAMKRLTVEITESGLIDELGNAAAVFAGLRALGCRVAIDDFGTGYSSLAYLKALPLDYLKIDKHLAQDIAGTTRDRVVVRGVIDMARSLGLAVIAEGVETERQLALLAEEGCNYYQGYLYSGAVGVEELVRLIAVES